MHARLVPTCRMPDIIRTRHHDSHHRSRTFISRLRVKCFGPAQCVGCAPRNTVVARHLTNHEVHQTNFRRPCHGRTRLHRHRRQIVPINCRCPFANDLRIGQCRKGLSIQLGNGWRNRGRRVCPTKYERRTQNRLIACTKRTHRPQHGFIPNQWRIAITISSDHRVSVQITLTK